ncbi:hypothetical protein NC652_038943 [Populus alba x Populus x berolinensis]|nr:hypothetical protein NC652_038943 [Populus alba x Populus x berolinensis]
MSSPPLIATRIDSRNTSSACHGLQSHLKYICRDHRHLSDIYHFNHITSFISLSSDGISVEDVMIGLIEGHGVEAFPFTRKQIEELRIFNIKGIPALFIIGQDGETISTYGKAMISLYSAQAFPLTESRITEMKAALKKKGDALPRQVKNIKHQHALKLDMAKTCV